MSEYIRREDAVEETLKYIISSGVSNQSTWNECVRTIADTLQDMRPADVVPVVHGKWEHHMSFGICDKCGYEYNWTGTDAKNYCPNCGAKMDGEKKE